jgi:hypothetical protein
VLASAKPIIVEQPMPAAKKKAPSASADSDSNAKKKPEPIPFVTDDAGKAFTHFLPLAEALPNDDVIVRGADVNVALVNIRHGVDAIKSHTDTIRKQLPAIAVYELLELPALGLALMHADGRVGNSASTREIDAAFSRK